MLDDEGEIDCDGEIEAEAVKLGELVFVGDGLAVFVGDELAVFVGDGLAVFVGDGLAVKLGVLGGVSETLGVNDAEGVT